MGPPKERTINIEQENNDCSSPKKLFRVVRQQKDVSCEGKNKKYRIAEQ
jgi:hypothetical protein